MSTTFLFFNSRAELQSTRVVYFLTKTERKQAKKHTYTWFELERNLKWIQFRPKKMQINSIKNAPN